MTEIPEWYTEFAAAVVAALPTDIDEATARGWAIDSAGLREALSILAAGAGVGPLKNDKADDGWELVRDAVEPESLSVADIEMAPFEEGMEDLIGEPMVELIMGSPNLLGQRHAEYTLDRQEQIPEEFQRYSLVFPGTIWRSQDGNHQVPCLVWRQGSWELIFGILEGGFDSRDRMAQLRAA